jgi:multisubunit Na+/H+ antiporter MnhB subunit
MNRIFEIVSKLAIWNRRPYGGIRRPGARTMEMERIEKTRREFEDHFRTTMLTVVGGAFAFVMALFWNDAIKETITMIVPAEKTLFYKYVAAVLVTAIGVLALFVMAKVLKGGAKA